MRDNIYFKWFMESLREDQKKDYNSYSTNEQNIWYISYLEDHYSERKVEEKKEIKYLLTDYNKILIKGSNEVTIEDKVYEQDLFEYGIVNREDLLEELMGWISEDSKDKLLMMEDLKMLMKVPDDYIFSSGRTNEYIYQESAEFDETCEKLIELNKTVK